MAIKLDPLILSQLQTSSKPSPLWGKVHMHVAPDGVK